MAIKTLVIKDYREMINRPAASDTCEPQLRYEKVNFYYTKGKMVQHSI